MTTTLSTEPESFLEVPMYSPSSDHGQPSRHRTNSLIRRVMLASFLALSVTWAFGAEVAEEARTALAEGNAALERANADPDQNLIAALAFAKALPAYEASDDQETAADIRAALFWCKKRMNLQALTRFVATHDADGRNLTEVLAAVERPVDSGAAAEYLAKADSYARQNPKQALKIAIRYFEVADRFQGTPESLTAQRLSLDALQQSLLGTQRADGATTAAVHAEPVAAERLPDASQKAVDASNKIVDGIAAKTAQDLADDRKKAVEAVLKEAEVAQRKGDLDLVLVHQRQASDPEVTVPGLSKSAMTAVDAYRRARERTIIKAAAAVVAERRKLLQTLTKAQKDETKKGNTDGALALKATIDSLTKSLDQAAAASLAGVKETVRPFVIRPNGGVFLGKLPTKKAEGSELVIAKDQESASKVVMIDGERCYEYLFAHAPSFLSYDVPAGAKQFTAYGLSLGYQSVKFAVALDGKTVFLSNTPDTYPKNLVPINIMIPEGAKRLELTVDPCGDNVADHSVWAFPYFSR